MTPKDTIDLDTEARMRVLANVMIEQMEAEIKKIGVKAFKKKWSKKPPSLLKTT